MRSFIIAAAVIIGFAINPALFNGVFTETTLTPKVSSAFWFALVVVMIFAIVADVWEFLDNMFYNPADDESVSSFGQH